MVGENVYWLKYFHKKSMRQNLKLPKNVNNFALSYDVLVSGQNYVSSVNRKNLMRIPNHLVLATFKKISHKWNPKRQVTLPIHTM